MFSHVQKAGLMMRIGSNQKSSQEWTKADKTNAVEKKGFLIANVSNWGSTDSSFGRALDS